MGGGLGVWWREAGRGWGLDEVGWGSPKLNGALTSNIPAASPPPNRGPPLLLLLLPFPHLFCLGFRGASVSMTGRSEVSTRSWSSKVWRQMASMSSQLVTTPCSMGCDRLSTPRLACASSPTYSCLAAMPT